LEKQKTSNSQDNIEQKRVTLEISQYPTSSYTTEPQQQKQHGTDIKTYMKTSGTE
jgi:hypothetical protein